MHGYTSECHKYLSTSRPLTANGYDIPFLCGHSCSSFQFGCCERLQEILSSITCVEHKWTSSSSRLVSPTILPPASSPSQLLRQNLGFKKLDLSRCFLSDKTFLSLAQALAWNCRVEEVRASIPQSIFSRHTCVQALLCRDRVVHPKAAVLRLTRSMNLHCLFIKICMQICLKECVFTDVRTAALADVVTVNKHIRSIDIRGCQGERAHSLITPCKFANTGFNSSSDVVRRNVHGGDKS